jgi:hypothetical protein
MVLNIRTLSSETMFAYQCTVSMEKIKTVSMERIWSDLYIPSEVKDSVLQIIESWKTNNYTSVYA